MISKAICAGKLSEIRMQKLAPTTVALMLDPDCALAMAWSQIPPKVFLSVT
jgi:hypothetical protein